MTAAKNPTKVKRRFHGAEVALKQIPVLSFQLREMSWRIGIRWVSPKRSASRVLLFLLAEQAEALFLVLLFVLLPLAGTRLGGECDGGRERLSASGRWSARVAAFGGTVASAGVQDGLDPGAHLLLQGGVGGTPVRTAHI